MLQRQNMFKQLQELQRNQQLQELGDTRNQEYMNQLSSLKQPSPVQLAPALNGEPLCYSQMLVLGNMQMMQHGGSNVFQVFPNGFISSQGQNHGLSLSTPQFELSGYGSVAQNTDKNLNPYSQLLGLSSQLVNMSEKNNNRIRGISGMHQSGFPSLFPNQQGSFTSDQISRPDAALVPNEMYHEDSFFGHVPVQSLNHDLLSANYNGQRIRMQSPEDSGWNGVSPLKATNVAMPEADASLDPLERKILYETDDNNLGLLFEIDKGGFQNKEDAAPYADKFSSIRSGSWSALMQSAVAENSSSDNGMQEDWGGLSFHYQEQPSDNLPATVFSNEKLQNNWVDRNLQNVSSPSSELQKPDMNYSPPDFWPSGQHSKLEGELQPNNTHPWASKSSCFKICLHQILCLLNAMRQEIHYGCTGIHQFLHLVVYKILIR